MSGEKVTLVQAQGLFPTPIFLYKINDYENVNRLLREDIQSLMSESPGITRSNQRGWHSDGNIFAIDKPGFKSLCSGLVECLTNVVARTRTTHEDEALHLVCTGWVNVNPQHAFNVPHDHPGCVWSGTYYVQVPCPEFPDSDFRSGLLEFLDPRMNAHGVPGSATKYPVKYRITPHEGNLVIFPSYLRHWVYPNEEEQDRISIAFNCSFSRNVHKKN